MTNREISKILRRTAALLELRGENAFRVKNYINAALTLDKLTVQLSEVSPSDYGTHGFSAGMAEKIAEIRRLGTYPPLDTLEKETPAGLSEMLSLGGLGAKKIRLIRENLGIETLPKLEEACLAGKVAELKGFGEKTQAEILKKIKYKKKQKGKFLFAAAAPYAEELETYLRKQLPENRIALAGEMRRNMEVVEEIAWVIACENPVACFAKTTQILAQWEKLVFSEKTSNPFVWRGYFPENGLKTALHFAKNSRFANECILQTSAPQHLALRANAEEVPLRHLLHTKNYTQETDFYAAIGWQFVPPELREGIFEKTPASEQKIPELLSAENIKGILHCHSTYSDGKNSLAEMAHHCKALGYEYLGITDHSQTAFYANGLKADRIEAQHKEIDQLNAQLAPFKIFKGIESDILSDGSLDYPEEILRTFDFVIASVHANLKMDKEKATNRLLKAIENPYTTILGHPSGRLLLEREGYPLDYCKVLEACAQHKVAVEINANPRRLDLDWRWVQRALNLGVRLSINPDAHEKNGYAHIEYGVRIARKGGLTAAQNLSSLSKTEIEAFFRKKKENL